MNSYTLNSTAANQKISTVIDGFRFDITIMSALGLMFATTAIDGVVVKTSCRCVNGQPIVPYDAYLPEGCGNFFFVTLDDCYPNHNDFNTNCIMVYLTANEIAELRAARKAENEG